MQASGLAAIAVACLACSSSAPASSSGDPPGDPADIGGDRPTRVFVPTSYDGTKPFPVLILLHGYSVTGGLQELYMRFQPIAEKRGFLYANPTGTLDAKNKPFWNAGGFGPSTVDDVGYLIGLVHQIEKNFNVDRKRVYFAGHSNGAFMAYHLACKYGDEIAAIAGLAGAMWTDASSCKGTIPVSVLALHGTADDTIKYDGGELLGMKYTSALATAKAWAATDGCDAQPDESALPIDVDAKIAGAETTISRWTKGCKANTGVELWTMKDSPHIPLPLADDFASRVTDFLFAHAKP